MRVASMGGSECFDPPPSTLLEAGVQDDFLSYPICSRERRDEEKISVSIHIQIHADCST